MLKDPSYFIHRNIMFVFSSLAPGIGLDCICLTTGDVAIVLKVQSIAIIMRCFMSWYFIQQCNGNSRTWIKLRIHKRHPISCLMGSYGMSFMRILEQINHVINGTELYIFQIHHIVYRIEAGKIALRWMSQGLTNMKSTLVLTTAWCW